MPFWRNFHQNLAQFFQKNALFLPQFSGGLNRKPYMIYQIVPFSIGMTLNRDFKGTPLFDVD